MWRNGRRNGLKIRFREIEVWVRVPPSAPSEKAVFIEGNRPIRVYLMVAQGNRRKRMKTQKNAKRLEIIATVAISNHGYLVSHQTLRASAAEIRRSLENLREVGAPFLPNESRGADLRATERDRVAQPRERGRDVSFRAARDGSARERPTETV